METTLTATGHSSRRCCVLKKIKTALSMGKVRYKYGFLRRNNKRVGAEVAHGAHNPRVGRSKLPLANSKVFSRLRLSVGTLGVAVVDAKRKIEIIDIIRKEAI